MHVSSLIFATYEMTSCMISLIESNGNYQEQVIIIEAFDTPCSLSFFLCKLFLKSLKVYWKGVVGKIKDKQETTNTFNAHVTFIIMIKTL